MKYANNCIGRFVDNNMFRSILECEVNLKEKIVSDFVNNLKPNPLDYNLTTHTMKLKTDYLLLTKKLYEYLLHFGIMKIDPEVELSSIEKIHESQLPTYKVPEERMCSLKVSIIWGNNIKNPIAETAPPNAYICMNVPFETEEKELRTPVVYRTTFPQWNYDYEIKGISINDICWFLMRNELEFDVYHKKMPTDGMYTNQESMLIGRTYIDASALVKNPDCMSISGYYHIFKDRTDKDIDNYADTIQATQGQIRIELKVNKPLLWEYDTEKRQHKAVLQNFNLINKDYSAVEETKLEPEDALQRAIRSAQELRAKHRELNQKDTAAQIRKLSRSPEPVPRRQQDENYDSNVMPTSIEELRFKKEMHLKELADMTLRMKLSLQGGRPDLDEDSPERNDDMFARDSSSAFEEVSDNS